MAPGIVRAAERVGIWHEAADEPHQPKMQVDYDDTLTKPPPAGETPTPAPGAVTIPNSNKFKGPANSLKKTLDAAPHPSQGFHPPSTQAVQDWADKNPGFTKSYFKPDYADAVKAHIGEDNYAKLIHHGPTPVTDPLSHHAQNPVPKSNKWAPAKSLKTLLSDPHTESSHVQDWMAKYPGFASTYFKPGYTDALKSTLGPKNYDELLGHLDDAQHQQLTGKPKTPAQEAKEPQALKVPDSTDHAENLGWIDQSMDEDWNWDTNDPEYKEWSAQLTPQQGEQFASDVGSASDDYEKWLHNKHHPQQPSPQEGVPDAAKAHGDALQKIHKTLTDSGVPDTPELESYLNDLDTPTAHNLADGVVDPLEHYNDFGPGQELEPADLGYGDEAYTTEDPGKGGYDHPFGFDEDKDAYTDPYGLNGPPESPGFQNYLISQGIDPNDYEHSPSLYNDYAEAQYKWAQSHPGFEKFWKSEQAPEGPKPGDEDWDEKQQSTDDFNNLWHELGDMLSDDPDQDEATKGQFQQWWDTLNSEQQDSMAGKTVKPYNMFKKWQATQADQGDQGDIKAIQDQLEGDPWATPEQQQPEPEPDPGTQHPALASAIAKLFPNATGPDNQSVANMTDQQMKGMLESWLHYLPDHEGFNAHVPKIQALYDQYFGGGAAATQPASLLDALKDPGATTNSITKWFADHPSIGPKDVELLKDLDPDAYAKYWKLTGQEPPGQAPQEEWEQALLSQTPMQPASLQQDLIDATGISWGDGWDDPGEPNNKEGLYDNITENGSWSSGQLAAMKKVYEKHYGPPPGGWPVQKGDDLKSALIDAGIFEPDMTTQIQSWLDKNPEKAKVDVESLAKGISPSTGHNLGPTLKAKWQKVYDTLYGGAQQGETPDWLEDNPYKEHYPEYMKLPGEIPDDPVEAEADFNDWASHNHPEATGLPTGFKAWAEDAGVPLEDYNEKELAAALKGYAKTPQSEKQQFIDQEKASKGGYKRFMPAIEQAMDGGHINLSKYKIMKTPEFKKWFEQLSPKEQQAFDLTDGGYSYNKFKYEGGDYDNDYTDAYNKALDEYNDDVVNDDWAEQPPASSKGVDVDALNKGLEEIYGEGIMGFDPHQSAEQVKKEMEGPGWLGDAGDTQANLKALQKLYDKHFGPQSAYNNYSPPGGAWDPLKKPQTDEEWANFGQMLSLGPEALQSWKGVDDDHWAKAIQSAADSEGYPEDFAKGITQWMSGQPTTPAATNPPFDAEAAATEIGNLTGIGPGITSAGIKYKDMTAEQMAAKLLSNAKKDLNGKGKQYQQVYDKWFGGKAAEQGPAIKVEVGANTPVSMVGEDGNLSDKAIQYLTENYGLNADTIQKAAPSWDKEDWQYVLKNPAQGSPWYDFAEGKPAGGEPGEAPDWAQDHDSTPNVQQLMGLGGITSDDAQQLAGQSPKSFWSNFQTVKESIDGGSTFWNPNDAWYKVVKAVEGQGGTGPKKPDGPPMWDPNQFAQDFKEILPGSGSSVAQGGVPVEKAYSKLNDLISSHPGTPETAKLEALKDKWFGKGMPVTPSGGAKATPQSAHPLALKYPGVFDKSGNPTAGFKNWFVKAKGIQLEPDLAEDMTQKLQKGSGSYWHGLVDKYMDDQGEADVISGEQEDITEEPAKPFKSEPLNKEDLKNWAGSKPTTSAQWKQFAKWWGNTKLTPQQEQGLYKAWFGTDVTPAKAGNWFQQLFEYNSTIGEGDLGEDIPNWAHNSWAFGKHAETEWPVFKEWAAKDSGIPSGTTLAQKVQIWNGLDDSEKAEIADNYAPAEKVDTTAIVDALQKAYPDSNFDKWKGLGQGSLKKSLESLAKNGYGSAVKLFNDNFGGNYEMPEEPPEDQAPEDKPSGPSIPAAPPMPEEAIPKWAKDNWGQEAPQQFGNFLAFAKSVGMEQAAMSGKEEGQPSYYNSPKKLMYAWNSFPPHIQAQIGAMGGQGPWSDIDAAKQWVHDQPKMSDEIKSILGPDASVSTYLDAHPQTGGYTNKYQLQGWQTLLAQHPEEPEHSALANLYQKFYGIGKPTLAEELKAIDPKPEGIKKFTNWDDWLQTHSSEDALKLIKKKLKAPGDPEKFVGYADIFQKHFGGTSGHKQVNTAIKYEGGHKELSASTLKQLHKWFTEGANPQMGLPDSYYLQKQNYEHNSPYITNAEAKEAEPGHQKVQYPSYVGWSPPLGVGEGGSYKADPAFFADSGKKKTYTAPEMAETGELKELQDNAKKWEPVKWDPATFLSEYKKAVPGLKTSLGLSSLKEGPDAAKKEVAQVLHDFPDMPFWQRQKLEGLWDSYFRNSALSEKDKITLKTPAFKQWFNKAPKKYRSVMKRHPGIAIDDYEGFLEGHDLYPEVPEGPGKEKAYHLNPEDFVPRSEKRKVVKFPGGQTMTLDPRKNYESEHEDPEESWHGFTKNPMRNDTQRRTQVVPEEIGPESAGQLEMMLPPGERIEPPHKPVELHRGIGIDLDKYENSPPQPPSKHLETSNPDLYRSQMTEYQRKLHRKWLLDQIRARFKGSSESKENVPDLFNTYEDQDTPKQELPEEWKYHAPQGMEGMFAFNQWAQKNNVPPEQMYELAKKWGVGDPSKYGVPPLSEGPWGKPIDPEKAAEADPRFAQLILDYLEAEDYFQSGWGYAPPGSLGDHWSATPDPTQGAPSSFAKGNLKAIVTGDWGGLGENPQGAHAMVGFGQLGSGENEINLSPGAPVSVKRLRLIAPEHGWTSYKDVPVARHTRYAATQEALDPHKPQHLFHLAVNWGIPDPERYGMAPQDDSTRQVESAISFLAGFDDYAPDDGGEGEWEEGYHPGPNEDWFATQRRPLLPGGQEHYYSPHALNPESNSYARPPTEWQEQEPEQDFLPGAGWSKDRAPMPVYRGMFLDLNKPGLEQVRRSLLGPQMEDNSKYGPTMNDKALAQADPRGYDNPDLGTHILNYVKNNPTMYDQEEHNSTHPTYGLGPHWSTSEQSAKQFAGYTNVHAPHKVPAVVRAQWKGLGEDPYRSDTAGDWPDENEVTMLPGSKMKVDSVKIQHPQTKQWHEVLGQPQEHHAAVTVRKRGGILSHSEMRR